MFRLLSPRRSGGALAVLVRRTECSPGLFRRVAVTGLCVLAAAGWGCGSGPEGGVGAPPGDAGAPPPDRAAPGRRVALVVGNDDYTGQSRLYNAVNDARAVAAALGEEGVGFSVTTLEDATRAELTSALASFTGSLREDDVALFYFAGHGVQVDGVNYLLPVDHAGQTEEAVRLDALSAASVEEMLRPARVAMLVFDACRNNPYRGVRGGTGLAPMEARGTLIAYAAGAGEVAADAAAPGVANGLFTSKFVEALEEPGLTASALFMRVRQEVVSASNEEQWPAVYNDLLSDFVFRGAASAGVAPSTGGSPSVGSDGVLSPVRAQQETVFWQSIQDSADAADFEAYLEQFPTGTFAPLARNRLAALRASAAPRPGPTGAPRPGSPEVATAAAAAPRPAAAVSPTAAAEAALGLDREARRRIQRGLAEAGFDPGPADGSFGVATRAAIRGWQASRGAVATGYLDGPAAASLAAPREAGALGEPREDPASPRPRRAGEVFRDCPSCPELVVIPAGEFLMGSPASEEGRVPEEGPQRRVRVERFALGRYEVTRAQYAAFVGATGHDGSRCYTFDGNNGFGWSARASWRAPGFAQTEQHPAVCVSWDDALGYVRWLSSETGHGYRLPSESEWEYAARAGTSTSRHWGNQSSSQCGYANGADVAARQRFDSWTTVECNDGRVFTAPVGVYGANRLGFFDMLGNALEWVQDCWHDNYQGARSDGRAWTSGGGCAQRVLRGGAWEFGPAVLRSAARARAAADAREAVFGFRVARALD